MLLKGNILRQFEFFYKDLYGKPLKRNQVARVVFSIHILLIFGGLYNRYFWGIRLTIYRLPYFNMLFKFVLTKFFKNELFSCLQKVDHVTQLKKKVGLFFAEVIYPHTKCSYRVMKKISNNSHKGVLAKKCFCRYIIKTSFNPFPSLPFRVATNDKKPFNT